MWLDWEEYSKLLRPYTNRLCSRARMLLLMMSPAPTALSTIRSFVRLPSLPLSFVDYTVCVHLSCSTTDYTIIVHLSAPPPSILLWFTYPVYLLLWFILTILFLPTCPAPPLTKLLLSTCLTHRRVYCYGSPILIAIIPCSMFSNEKQVVLAG